MEFAKYGPRLLCCLIFSISSLTPLHAQNSAENEYGSWWMFCGTTKIHEAWSIPTVGILRYHDLMDKYAFGFVSSGVSYKISSASSVEGGVAFLNSTSYSDLYDSKNSTQFWLYGSYTLKSNFKKDLILQRFRMENRRLITDEDPKANNRFRYRLQYVTPISESLYFKTYNELFLNLKGDVFNQNRLFVGIGQKINDHLKVETGYFNRKFSNRQEHMILFGLSFTIDLTKNQDLALQSN